MDDSKKDKYRKMFEKAKTYDAITDAAKEEFFKKFTKNELFELMWAYRTVLKYYAYEVIYPGDKEKAAKLLQASEKVAVLSARERCEKDGKIKKIREDLEKDLEKKTLN